MGSNHEQLHADLPATNAVIGKMPSQLRVLIVAPSTQMIGGQSVQADILLRRLALEANIAVSLQPINPMFAGSLGALQKIKFARTLVTIPAYVFQLIRSVRQADVVHVFSASYLSFVLSVWPAIRVARWFGKPLVLNYHSGEAFDHLRTWPSAVRQIRMANKLVVPSPFLVRVFQAHGLNAEVVPNVVDVQSIKFKARSEVRPRFLANRNFEIHYNVPLVLRAFRIIQDAIPDAILTVAGAGPCNTDIRELALNLGLRNINFVGRVNPADMPELYANHDIWLNGSDVDNMPLSILECFAAGVAIVSTNAGGIPDLVDSGSTGLLSACGDAAMLAKNAISLAVQPELHSRLTQAGKLECVKYTWLSVLSQWLELYNSVRVSKCPHRVA